MSARWKAIRTWLQTAASFLVLVVPFVAVLGLTAAQVAVVGGAVTFLAGAIAALQRVLEDNDYIGTVGPKPQPEVFFVSSDRSPAAWDPVDEDDWQSPDLIV